MGMAQKIEPVRHRNLKGSYGVQKQEHDGQNPRTSELKTGTAIKANEKGHCPGEKTQARVVQRTRLVWGSFPAPK